MTNPDELARPPVSEVAEGAPLPVGAPEEHYRGAVGETPSDQRNAYTWVQLPLCTPFPRLHSPVLKPALRTYHIVRCPCPAVALGIALLPRKIHNFPILTKGCALLQPLLPRSTLPVASPRLATELGTPKTLATSIQASRWRHDAESRLRYVLEICVCTIASIRDLVNTAWRPELAEHWDRWEEVRTDSALRQAVLGR